MSTHVKLAQCFMSNIAIKLEKTFQYQPLEPDAHLLSLSTVASLITILSCGNVFQFISFFSSWLHIAPNKNIHLLVSMLTLKVFVG